MGTTTKRQRTTRPLTDKAIKAAKPKAEPYRLRDLEGLYLEVRPTGSRLWRWQYRFGGKGGRLLALGQYPEVSLKRARERRNEAATLLAEGIDPAAARRETKAADAAAMTFETVALEFLAKRTDKDPRSEAQHLRRLKRHVFPAIGKRRVDTLETADLAAILERVEDAGTLELAHRLRTLIRQVTRYAVQRRYASRDPSPALRGALSKVKPKHFPAVTEPRAFARILAAIDGYGGEPSGRYALRLLPLVFVRPGELVRMRWADVDRDAKQWRFKASKTGADMIVPLSRQALAILDEVAEHTDGEELVFHSSRSKSKRLSENTLNSALRYMGIDSRTVQCAHGFRSSARTMLEEQKALGFRYTVIEMQLGHKVRDPLGRAYNRVSFLDERTEMMQVWADWLDKQKAELFADNVVNLDARRANAKG